MTNAQKIRLRLSQVRQRLNEISGLEGDDFTDEIRSEAQALQTEYRDLEARHQAVIVAEGEGETRANGSEDLDAEARERLELRSQASLTAYLRAALSGRQVDGPEAELRAAAGVGDGIPLELWDVPSVNGDRETRADAPTGAPGTVGVNLDRIRPQVFVNSIAPRLGIEMPRVSTGTYASATITTSLTAGSHAKGSAAEATAAGFTVSSVTPKRISARLGIRIEDVAAVGQANFESILRENLSLVLSDALEEGRAVIVPPRPRSGLQRVPPPRASLRSARAFPRVPASETGACCRARSHAAFRGRRAHCRRNTCPAARCARGGSLTLPVGR